VRVGRVSRRDVLHHHLNRFQLNLKTPQLHGVTDDERPCVPAFLHGVFLSPPREYDGVPV
jgi:hypothetical protein